MKPTVISNANANPSANGSADAAANAINIPINHENMPHYANAEANASAYSPHQIPAHFQQSFGFEPDMDMDMDMFPRGRIGRMHHDPFAGFGSSHFGFPQFGSMGRRRVPAETMDEDSDIFNRIPTEFRQYIPDGFGHRRAGSGTMPQQHHPQHSQHPQHPQQQYQQHQPQMPPHQQQQQPHYQYQAGTPPNTYGAGMQPPSPSKKLCDAAIQTEDPLTGAAGAAGHDAVDHSMPTRQNENLNQHGLRNTVDMGVKTTAEGEQHSPRAQSAPPPQQMEQNSGSHTRRVTPPHQTQFGTQTVPQTKAYYAPQQQPHPQQKQQTPPPSHTTQGQPQTPGGTYVRTIPIFVEGRSEPIINSHKEIPNQNAPPNTQSRQGAPGFPPHPHQHPHAHPQPQQQFYTQPQQQSQSSPNAQFTHRDQPQPQHHQQHAQRPTPLNTQQQTEPQSDAAPPQTPHTLDSINKIQNIQRDVLDLMSKVEKFTGTRKEKEYAYLDEMLTRNLLKLDTIDTQGKDSIRLARKEAIKCIQASINVLEAKAEENARNAQGGGSSEAAVDTAATAAADASDASAVVDEAGGNKDGNSEAGADVSTKSQDPIPLPPPVDEKSSNAEQVESSSQDAGCAATDLKSESSTSIGGTIESK